MSHDEKCKVCGKGDTRRGWDRNWYCCEAHEKANVSRLHASMPGGPVPYAGWVPAHISREIAERWN